MEAFESKSLVRRTPELGEEIPECVTPANTEDRSDSQHDGEEQHIVNIVGPDVPSDDDNDGEGFLRQAGDGGEGEGGTEAVGDRDITVGKPFKLSETSVAVSSVPVTDVIVQDEAERSRVDNILARAGLLRSRPLGPIPGDKPLCDKKPVLLPTLDVENDDDRLVIEAGDKQVNDLILEGIRQATASDDNNDDEDNESYDEGTQIRSVRKAWKDKDPLSYEYNRDEDRFGDPEIEDIGELSDTSDNPAEELIVIDKSIHLSPKQSPAGTLLYSVFSKISHIISQFCSAKIRVWKHLLNGKK